MNRKNYPFNLGVYCKCTRFKHIDIINTTGRLEQIAANGAEGLGLILGPVKSDGESPTSRHRRNVSSELLVIAQAQSRGVESATR